MFILSFLLFCLSIIYFIKNRTEGKMGIFIYSFFVLLFFLITDTYYIFNYFTGKGLDNSVIYYFRYGGEGTGWLEYKNIMIVTIISLFFIIIFLYKFINWNLKSSVTSYKNISHKKLVYIILFFSFLIHPLVNNIFEMNGIYSFVNFSFSNDSLFFDYYNKPIYKDIENKKNIIYIYLESYEKLFLDEKLFPGLSPGLNEIKSKSIYFDNLHQAYGTSWTIAGMVGSQCGIPLDFPGDLDIGETNKSYLKKAFCLGDYLKKSGYDLKYVGGSSMGFAGKGNFYKTHGFDSIEGKDEFVSDLSNKEYIYSWGLYDDTNFSNVYNKYDELSKGDKPFGLFTISMDTHGDSGVISNECKGFNYNDDEESILNSYHCTDYLVSNFIEKIKNHPNFHDTIFIVGSDHYAMDNNNAVDILKDKKDERGLFFMIYDPENPNAKIITKKGDTLDIGSTVLNYLGFPVDVLGLGKNLFNDNISRDWELPLTKWKKDYQSFWK